MKLNRKGYVVLSMPVGAFVVFCLLNVITARAFYETSQNGVLKKNGQKIWCKVQNKGKDYCDSQYK